MKAVRNIVLPRIFMILSFLIFVCLLCLYCYEEARVRLSDDPLEKSMQVRAGAFKVELESTFLEKSKKVSQRAYDLGEVCRKYFPSGAYLSEIRMIMVAVRGRQENALWPVQTKYSVMPANETDVASGFYLQKQFLFSSTFNIVFRLDVTDKQKISGVVSCGVTNSGL